MWVFIRPTLIYLNPYIESKVNQVLGNSLEHIETGQNMLHVIDYIRLFEHEIICISTDVV